MKAVDGATASPLDSSNAAGVDGAENSAGATAAEDPDTQVQNTRRAADMTCHSEAVRTLALKCEHWPEASKEMSVLGETVRCAAKSLMNGSDPGVAACQHKLLEILKSSEKRNYDLTTTLVRGSHHCRDLLQVVMDAYERIDRIFDLTGRGAGAGSNVKFDSKFIEAEMKRIETVVQQFRYMEEVLGSCCDRGRNHAMLDVLQDALDNISSSDILGELRNVWEE